MGDRLFHGLSWIARRALLPISVLLACHVVLAAEPDVTSDAVTLSPRIDWTADGQVLITTTLLSRVPTVALADAQLQATSSDGAAAAALPASVGTSLGQSLTTSEQSFAQGPVSRSLGTIKGAQVAGLFIVPQDRPSSIQLTFTASTPSGPVTVTKTLTINPQAIRSKVVILQSADATPSRTAFPPTSHVEWNAGEAH